MKKKAIAATCLATTMSLFASAHDVIDNTDRERRVTSIMVYSNVGQPKVFLNGQELEGIHKGFTDVHYVIDNVTLKDGENIVTTTATDKQVNKLSDEIRWQYTGEKRRSARQGNNNAEHAGF